MAVIDSHFHVVPQRFADALRDGEFSELVSVECVQGTERVVYRAPPEVDVEPDIVLSRSLYDDRLVIEALDKRKLDAAVLAAPPEHFYYWAEPDIGERLAQSFNDAMAAMVHAHPERFFGFATLPMQDGERAARELERAVLVLGLRGAEICTHINGVDLDDRNLFPVYAAAERLDVPLFLHPQNWGDLRRMRDNHLWNLVGFPSETALAAARLILGGVLETFPRLKVILAHGGGYFPYQVGRLDHGYRVRAELRRRLPKPPSEYLKAIYCDTLTHSALSLRFLLDRVGVDHVVLGSDYPFGMSYPQPVDVVTDLGLPNLHEAAVLGGNLARLLHAA